MPCTATALSPQVAHVYVSGSCDIVGAAMLEGVRDNKFLALGLKLTMLLEQCSKKNGHPRT